MLSVLSAHRRSNGFLHLFKCRDRRAAYCGILLRNNKAVSNYAGRNLQQKTDIQISHMDVRHRLPDTGGCRGDVRERINDRVSACDDGDDVRAASGNAAIGIQAQEYRLEAALQRKSEANSYRVAFSCRSDRYRRGGVLSAFSLTSGSQRKFALVHRWS